MTSPAQVERFEQSPTTGQSGINHLFDLPRMLRSIGAISLLAAISIFLFQGWENGNDVYRYMLLLGHTVGLAMIGFASGHWLGESKGARLLLIIALASVPANFAILGAFMYSQASMDALNVVYPSVAHWKVDGLTTAIAANAVGVLILAIVSWLGFMVLSRKSALRLTVLFLLTNAALILPVRIPEVIALMLLVLTVIVAKQSLQSAGKDTALRTPEGMIARLLLYVPLGVIVGRNLWLYSADGFMFSILSVIVFILFRQVAMQLNRDSTLRKILEIGSVAPALTFGFGVCVVALDVLSDPLVWLLPVFAISVSILLLELSTRVAKGALLYRRFAAALMSIAVVSNLVLFSSVATAAVCLAVGLAVLVYGYMVEQRIVFALGTITLLAGLIYQMQFAIDMFNLGSWGSLAALGVAAILVGSTIERHGVKMKTYLTGWGRRIKQWDN
jgi:hypothetical protein